MAYTASASCPISLTSFVSLLLLLEWATCGSKKVAGTESFVRCGGEIVGDPDVAEHMFGKDGSLVVDKDSFRLPVCIISFVTGEFDTSISSLNTVESYFRVELVYTVDTSDNVPPSVLELISSSHVSASSSVDTDERKSPNKTRLEKNGR